MEGYKKIVKEKMDSFVKSIFLVSKYFPRDEQYITCSQLKRASLSVILNYIEGYARFKPKIQLNFLEISYGSLKEVGYLVDFSKDLEFISNKEYTKIKEGADELGAILWSEMKLLRSKIDL